MQVYLRLLPQLQGILTLKVQFIHISSDSVKTWLPKESKPVSWRLDASTLLEPTRYKVKLIGQLQRVFVPETRYSNSTSGSVGFTASSFLEPTGTRVPLRPVSWGKACSAFKGSSDKVIFTDAPHHMVGLLVGLALSWKVRKPTLLLVSRDCFPTPFLDLRGNHCACTGEKIGLSRADVICS